MNNENIGIKKEYTVRRVVIIILSVLLLASVVANLIFVFNPFSSGKFEGRGYSSPEKAITAYAKALKKGDVDKMISTFAIETKVDKMDYKKYYESMPSFYSSSLIPSDSDEFPGKFNRYKVVETLRSNMLNQCYVMLDLYDNEDFNLHTFHGTAEEFNDLVRDNKLTQKLRKAKIGDIVCPEDLDEYDEEVYEEYVSEKENIYQSKNVQSLGIEFEFDGEDYYIFMDVVEYDGKWYNLGLSNIMYTFSRHIPITYITKQ